MGGPAVTPVPIRHKEKIACIGGGPASLACAAELRQQGYAVTVFDNRPLPGGLTTYGVAEYKLRPSDSLREVEMIKSLGRGVPRRGGRGRRSLDELEKEFALVFLGLGLGAMQRLGIPGEDARGCHRRPAFHRALQDEPGLPGRTDASR